MIVMGALDGEQERERGTFKGQQSGPKRWQMFENGAVEEGPPGGMGATPGPDTGLAPPPCAFVLQWLQEPRLFC